MEKTHVAERGTTIEVNRSYLCSQSLTLFLSWTLDGLADVHLRNKGSKRSLWDGYVERLEVFRVLDERVDVVLADDLRQVACRKVSTALRPKIQAEA